MGEEALPCIVDCLFINFEQGGATPAAGGSGDTAATGATTEWESRAIVGFHQAGASSANFTQNFFFDFFVMRALSETHLWGPKEKAGDAEAKGMWKNRWSLWGDVRISSTPQQITTAVGTFVSSFATTVSNLPVNQLAQSADFQTGWEYRMHTLVRASGYRMIGLVADFGALGSFQEPSSQMQIYDVPSQSSPQYALFAQTFPTAVNYKYVGFVPPNRERFYRSYGAGFRVTTFPKDNTPPATYTFTAGQDEAITGGIFRSVVSRFDVFYPMPFPGANNAFKSFYLFGTSNLRLSTARNVPTFALQNPNAPPPGSTTPPATLVQPYDPGLAVVTVRSTRDTYRIGVGVDLIGLITTLANPPSK
jgi:hypothetical protein